MNSIDTPASPDQVIETREEVSSFLEQVIPLLDDPLSWQINNTTWAGKVNKTQRYLAETNLHDDDVANVIRELKICNYCYTADDRNSNFPNEKFRFFGITKQLIDTEEDFYIKLKIRQFDTGFLLVMSFHPEQPKHPQDKLTFPYAT